jgi:hypothetical protein
MHTKAVDDAVQQLCELFGISRGSITADIAADIVQAAVEQELGIAEGEA